ncbi:hypothetical protein HDR66_03610, partial [bacterium]|nr:hypothetical protein [bacterium]
GVLYDEFTDRAGGMFLLDFDAVPDWQQYAGYKNALAFSMIQTVSHTQIMMFSDLALLFLRFAQIVGPAYNTSSDAINYYMGQYFYNNNGDWASYYSAIPESSPYHLFGVMRTADKNNDFENLARAMRTRPLFVPGAMRLVAHYTANGDRRSVRDVIQRGLDDKNVTDAGRGYFLKMRARAHLAFGDIDSAQEDIRAASDIIPNDAEIFGIQAKIWAAKDRELDNAYEYAMKLVSHSPSDVAAWDVLGCVVAKREGIDAALELLERVGDIANNCSSLFVQLGDLYVTKGDVERARNAYLRAIDLAEDGLTVVSHVEKKLRKLK